MERDPETIITKLKQLLSAKNDADLARKLAVDKRTISSWKLRGKVPERFVGIANGESSLALGAAPANWSAPENAALALALYRYAVAYSDVVGSHDFERTMRMVSNPGDLWALFSEAQADIRKTMGDGSQNLSAALAVLVHRELENPAARRQVLQDFILDHRAGIEWSDGATTDAAGQPKADRI